MVLRNGWRALRKSTLGQSLYAGLKHGGGPCAGLCRSLFASLVVLLLGEPLVSARLFDLSGEAAAKTPGEVHCYGTVCNRVRTIAETVGLVGTTYDVVSSYYDDPSRDKHTPNMITSSGEAFDASSPYAAASADLPDGTEILVWNPANGRANHVRVNDFGPFADGRKLDVTRRVAEDLGFVQKGTMPLRVTVIAAPTSEESRYKAWRRYTPVRGHLGVVSKAGHGDLVRSLVASVDERRSLVQVAEAKTPTVVGSLVAPVAPVADMPPQPQPVRVPAAEDKREPASEQRAAIPSPVVSAISGQSPAVQDVSQQNQHGPYRIASVASVTSVEPPSIAGPDLPSRPPTSLQPTSTKVIDGATSTERTMVERPVGEPRAIATEETAKAAAADTAATVTTAQAEPAATAAPAVTPLPRATVSPEVALPPARVAALVPPPIKSAVPENREPTVQLREPSPQPTAFNARPAQETNAMALDFSTPGMPTLLLTVLALTLLTVVMAGPGRRRRLARQPKMFASPRGAMQSTPASLRASTAMALRLANDTGPASAGPPGEPHHGHDPHGHDDVAYETEAQVEIATVQTPADAERPAAARIPVPKAQLAGADLVPGAALIPEDMEISGSITTPRNLHILGRIQGDARGLTVLVSRQAMVDGRVLAQTAIIAGQVRGGIEADHVRILAGSAVDGDVIAGTIEIEDGAFFEGRVLRRSAAAAA